MRRIISIILSICLFILALPCFTYITGGEPVVTIDDFAQSLTEIEKKYDITKELFSTIMFKNNSEFYYVDGDDYLLTDKNGDVVNAVVKNHNLKVPFETVKCRCEKYTEKEYVNLSDLKELGFDVEFVDDIAILSRTLQTNRIIVKSESNINPLDSVDIVEDYNDLHIVQFDDEESTKEALEYYNDQKNIEYAEPDMIMSIQNIDYSTPESTTSSDAIFYDNHLSWGSEYIGVDDYIDYLGDVNELPEIVVGIIDTGIITNHEFLANRVIETGINYSDSGSTNSEKDDNGHGTHVAGIVADNTTDNVKIKGYKVLNSKGSGTTSNICLAIDKAVEDNVNVINMSLGGKGTDSLFTETVQNAVNSGVIVCAAAGNEGANANNYSPASIDACITVAAIDNENDIPYWSNYGSCVDIIAPGVNIYSSYIYTSDERFYKTLSGTSMACPFVSAASALILSKYPNYTKDNVLEVLQTNGRSISLPERFDGLKVLYIGTVTEYDRERTAVPEFSVESGYYENCVTVEITCADENAEIYYTTDGTRASQDNGILYTEPVVIDRSTSLHAAAYAPHKLKSLQASAQYYVRYMDDEGNFEIDEEGTITAYNGDNDYLIVPDTVSGITVTGIGLKVFYQSSIVMCELPDTVTHLDAYSFYWCRNLVSLKANGLINVGNYALARNSKLTDFDVSNLEQVEKYGCFHIGVSDIYNDKLTEIHNHAFSNCVNVINITLPNVITVYTCGLSLETRCEVISLPKVESLYMSALQTCFTVRELNFPNLVYLGQDVFESTSNLQSLSIPQYHGPITAYLFHSTGLKEIDNDSFTDIEHHAFSHSKIETVILKNAATVGEEAFDECRKLKTLYLPSVTEIGEHAFRWTEENEEIETLFLPSLISTKDLPVVSEKLTIYLSEKFTDYEITWYHDQNCTIVAPKGSYAEEFAKTGFPNLGNSNYVNNMRFIPSDYLVKLKFSYMNNNQLCFEFFWENIDEIEQYADSITYYFEVDGETVAADTVHTESGKTYFGYQTDSDDEQTIRAVVNIDGMLFKSEPITVSHSAVSEPDNGCEHEWTISSYNSIFNDTIITLHCSNCQRDYIVSFSNYLNRGFPPLDLNNDGIVNAKDFAIIQKQCS